MAPLNCISKQFTINLALQILRKNFFLHSITYTHKCHTNINTHDSHGLMIVPISGVSIRRKDRLWDRLGTPER